MKHIPQGFNNGICGHDDIEWWCTICGKRLSHRKDDRESCLSDDEFCKHIDKLIEIILENQRELSSKGIILTNQILPVLRATKMRIERINQDEN